MDGCEVWEALTGPDIMGPWDGQTVGSDQDRHPSVQDFYPPNHSPVPTPGERILASGSVQLPRFTLLESGSLLISPTRLSDAGTYTCLASNSRGVDEASADLVVWGECPQHSQPLRE